MTKGKHMTDAFENFLPNFEDSEREMIEDTLSMLNWDEQGNPNPYLVEQLLKTHTRKRVEPIARRIFSADQLDRLLAAFDRFEKNSAAVDQEATQLYSQMIKPVFHELVMNYEGQAPLSEVLQRIIDLLQQDVNSMNTDSTESDWR